MTPPGLYGLRGLSHRVSTPSHQYGSPVAGSLYSVQPAMLSALLTESGSWHNFYSTMRCSFVCLVFMLISVDAFSERTVSTVAGGCSCAAAPEGVNSLDGGVAAEPTFNPTLSPSTCRTLQVERCKMPSICELPQGSAPGKYLPRRGV